MQYEPLDFLSISPYMRFIHTDITKDQEINNYVYTIPWRYLYDYELIFLFGGELTVETETEKYTLHAGDIHIMPPLVKHRRYTMPGTRIKLFSMHFDMFYLGKENDFQAIDVYSKPCEKKIEFVEIDKKLLNRPFYSLSQIELPSKLTVSEPSQYLQILNDTLKIYNEKPFGYELDLKIHVLQILRLIIADMHSADIHANKNRNKLMQCIDYINNNFNKEFDMNELAIKNGLTPNYFRRLFKKATGKSPKEYLTDMRLKHAVDLMRTGMYPIAKVCNMVGYSDIHYFSRLFKKKKGKSPSKFYR